MSGIPVYTQSPINAVKAAAMTPQTAAPSLQTTPKAPASVAATSTATMPAYPAAQPGAAAPASTGAAQRYTPLQPTPTTKINENGPPAPQPGAAPTAGFQSSIPPPPKPGQSYQLYQPAPPTPAHSMPQLYPPQMGMPPPTGTFGAQPLGSSTTTSNTSSSAYPIALPVHDARRQSLEHPPGYHQNVYASELTSDQRRAQEASNASTPAPSGLPGLGGLSNPDEGSGLDAASIFNTAKKWAQVAGEKISEGEKEVWRRINKES
ncbi:hypothetical protein BP6252_07907 [Coleophoma cylindrospora]|uniref:Uncharacterized protein n=1 Tax=Coleophoma cylindrospora TaxID=1849047 RepID=A0A3D8RBV5_9HELO|nr:hypothetical protein BP6252_07907 [Coleophoma cylindrospora]